MRVSHAQRSAHIQGVFTCAYSSPGCGAGGLARSIRDHIPAVYVNTQKPRRLFTWQTGQPGKPGSRLRVPGSRLRVPGSRLRVPGSRLRVPGSRLAEPGNFQVNSPARAGQRKIGEKGKQCSLFYVGNQKDCILLKKVAQWRTSVLCSLLGPLTVTRGFTFCCDLKFLEEEKKKKWTFEIIDSLLLCRLALLGSDMHFRYW